MESETMKLIYMTAAVVVLFALAIFQGVTLVKMKQYLDESQRFTEYWRHKTDSLSDENFKLYMQINELKDSIMTYQDKAEVLIDKIQERLKTIGE